MAEEYTPNQLIPKRNPSLIQRIAQRIVKADPALGPQPQQQQTTQSSVAAEATKTIWDKYFLTQNDRQAVYQDVDEMDSASEEVSVALDTIADNATTSEDGSMFSATIVSPSPKVQKVLDQIRTDIKADQKLYVWTRTAVKFGDMFLELVANNENPPRLVDVKLLPPSSVVRNTDAQGNFLMEAPRYDAAGRCLNAMGQCAFEQVDQSTQGVMAAFFPWQIVHGRWNHDGFSTYGRSMLRVTRIAWKKLKAEEEALIMGRLIRAMMKLVFYVDTTGMSRPQKQKALNDFKQDILSKTQIDGKRENPFSVLTDFFLAVENYRMGGQVVQSQTKIDLIDPKNEGLSQIDDIKFFHRKYLATLRVPPAYMGFEEQVNATGTVSMQDIEYVRFLRRLQQFMGHHLKQIYDVGLILQGIDPLSPENHYEIKWPPLSTTDQAAAADAEYKIAQSDALGLGTSSLNQTPYLSREWILRRRHGMDDDEIKTVLAQIEADKNADQTRQLAVIAAQAKIEADNRPDPVAPVPPTANPNGNGSSNGNGNNASQIHDHEQQADPAKAKNGSSTAKKLTQEIAVLAQTKPHLIKGE